MLIFLGLFIVSSIVGLLFFRPHSIFVTKKSNGASVFFTFLFMLFPVIVTIGLGESLNRKIGKNFPTYQKKLSEEERTSIDGVFIIERYKPAFKNWKYYLIALPSNDGVRGISKRIFLKVQKTE